MEVEEALESLGKLGRWQVSSSLIMVISRSSITAFHLLAIVWISHAPEHHCRVRNGVSINDSIPRDSSGKLSQCLKYVNLSLGNQTMACDDGWSYDSHDSYTIVNKWDFVCKNEFYSQLPQSILVIGMMFGAFVSSVISDKFGRKPVFMACQMSMVVVGIICAFVESFYVFLFLRFLAGFILQALVLTGFILVAEFLTTSLRASVGINLYSFFGLFSSLLALFAYLIKNWVHLQVFISLIGLFNIPLFWYLSESIPWLYANDRIDEAEIAIRKAAKMNKIKLPEVILKRKTKIILEMEIKNSCDLNSELEETFTKNTKPFQSNPFTYSFLDLIKSRTLLLYLTVSSFICFVVILVYFGLSLTTGNMEGNRFINGFYSGIIEIPANVMTYLLINNFGRKRSLIVLFVLSGSFSLAIPFIPRSTNRNILRCISIAGKLFITGCYTLVFLFITEIFPTNLRNQALGISSFFGRLGNLTATFVKYTLIKYPTVPSLVFSVLSFLAAASVLLLPETDHRPLPTTIEEVENWTKNTTMRKEIL